MNLDIGGLLLRDVFIQSKQELLVFGVRHGLPKEISVG